jgi:hypothetical protein
VPDEHPICATLRWSESDAEADSVASPNGVLEPGESARMSEPAVLAAGIVMVCPRRR